SGPDPKALPGKLPQQTDIRQMSLFGAGWTLASIKNLSEAGATCITYYETVGSRGILKGENSPDYPEFPLPYSIFPMFAVFKKILEFSEGEVVISRSSDPLQFDGIVIKKENKLRIILASLINKEINISIPS